MKVFLSNLLKISPGTRLPGSLSSLSVGDRVEAGLISKTGNKEALIEISGRRVHARFTGDVPDSPRLTLILNEIKNGSYIFNLDSAETLKKNLSLFSRVLLTGDINLHTLNSLPSSRSGDLFLLNLLLLGVPVRERLSGHSALLSVMNRMIGSGLSREDLYRLSLLFISNMPEPLAAIYRYLMKKKGVPSEKENKESINKFLESVDILDEKEKSDCIKELLNLNRKSDIFMMIPVFDGEGFSSLKMITNDGYYYISIDFTALGRIDIIMKTGGSHLDVTLVFDDDEKKEFFSQGLGGLSAELLHENLSANFKLLDRQFVEAEFLKLKNEFMIGGSFNTRI